MFTSIRESNSFPRTMTSIGCNVPTIQGVTGALELHELIALPELGEQQQVGSVLCSRPCEFLIGVLLERVGKRRVGYDEGEFCAEHPEVLGQYRMDCCFFRIWICEELVDLVKESQPVLCLLGNSRRI